MDPAERGLIAFREVSRIFLGTTPWGQIILVAVMAFGGAVLLTRLTGREGYGWSYATLVLAIASGAFGVIATIAFVWAGILAVISLALFLWTARTSRAR